MTCHSQLEMWLWMRYPQRYAPYTEGDIFKVFPCVIEWWSEADSRLKYGVFFPVYIELKLCL